MRTANENERAGGGEEGNEELVSGFAGSRDVRRWLAAVRFLTGGAINDINATTSKHGPISFRGTAE